jgi:copper homeostasis protein (lipoprotein)
MRLRFYQYLIFVIIISACSCKDHSAGQTAYVSYRGVYSFGPEMKSFTDCDCGQEYWVADSSQQLELTYSQLKFEKPYEPVYIEVKGIKVRSGKEGLGAEYDSTLVVKKLIKISKVIPQDLCN